MIIWIIIVLIFGVMFVVMGSRSWGNHNAGVDNLSFFVRNLNGNSSVEEINQFMEFIKHFKGSYCGNYIKRGVSFAANEHWGGSDYIDVRDIFFRAIAPNKNLTVESKEVIRDFMSKNLGIRKMDIRPNYDKYMNRSIASLDH